MKDMRQRKMKHCVDVGNNEDERTKSDTFRQREINRKCDVMKLYLSEQK